MRNFDAEMAHITSLQDVYDFCDANAISLLRDFELHAPWNWYLRTNAKEHERTAVKTELRLASLTILGKAFFDIAYAPGKTPEEIVQYPDGEKIAREAADYILTRAGDTKSPLLKARYHHLLWTGPKGIKRQERGTAAIEGYLRSIEEIIQLHERAPHDELPCLIIRLLETLLALVAEIKYRLAETMALCRQLIFETNWDFLLKNTIIGQTVEHKILLTKAAFGDIPNLYEQELATLTTPSDKYYFATYCLPTAVKAVQRLGADVKPWYNRIGNSILTFAKEGDTKVDWLKLKILMEALEAFTKAANKEAIAEVELLYAATQPTATLVTVPFSLGPRENAFATLLRKDKTPKIALTDF